MKIKSIIAAFAAVAMFAACSETALNEDGTKTKEGSVVKTTATFTLNLKQPGTKGLNYDPDPDALDVNQIAANEKFINPADVRLMIFDEVSQILEFNGKFDMANPKTVDAAFPDNSTAKTTVIVTTGNKKIFIFANAGGITGFDAMFAGFTEGVTTLTAFYNTAVFNAGTPQYVPFVDKTSAATRTFDITQLYTQRLVGGTTYGLPASTTNMFSYKLLADVLGSASIPMVGQPPQSYAGNVVSQDNNHFQIGLVFMVSKARLLHNSAITGASFNPNFSIASNSINYAIHNLARHTSYVLQTQQTSPFAALSWYNGKIWTGSATGLTTVAPTPSPAVPTNHYLYEFDGANTANVTCFATGTTPDPKWLYLPETANGTKITKGECPYYAIVLDYQPKHVIHSFSWDGAVGVQYNASNQAPITDAMFADRNYVLLRHTITGPKGTLAENTCYKTLALLQQMAWLCVHGSVTDLYVPGDPGKTLNPLLPTKLDEANDLIGITPPAIPTYAELLAFPFDASKYGYYVYTAAKSWYRANIGGVISSPQPTGFGPYPPAWPANDPVPYWYSIPEYGAVRGIAYDATITDVTGPGVPFEWMLDTDKPEPVKAETNITVVVKIIDWIHANQNVIIQ